MSDRTILNCQELSRAAMESCRAESNYWYFEARRAFAIKPHALFDAAFQRGWDACIEQIKAQEAPPKGRVARSIRAGGTNDPSRINGWVRLPGGLIPPEAAEALQKICEAAGESKAQVIARLLTNEAEGKS